MLGLLSCLPEAVGCPERPRKSCRILQPQEDLCPPFAEAIDSCFCSVELEGRILNSLWLKNLKWDNLYQFPPIGLLSKFLGKWTIFYVWKQILWEPSGNEFLSACLFCLTLKY